MSTPAQTLLTSTFCILICAAVILCGAHVKEVATMVRESGSQVHVADVSISKPSPELHDHIEKVSVKNFVKNVDTLQVNHRSLRFAHKTKKTTGSNSGHKWLHQMAQVFEVLA